MISIQKIAGTALAQRKGKADEQLLGNKAGIIYKAHT